MARADTRDVDAAPVATSPSGERRYIAVIGIDAYHHKKRLANAVSDARGVLATFAQLGFEPVVNPLIDAAATKLELTKLVQHDLPHALGPNDSLVLFFAGHGTTVVDKFTQGPANKTGYLIPSDATGERHTWIKLDHWLDDVTQLPARHILVILDSCYSGLALHRDVVFHSAGVAPAHAGDPVDRRSRRVLTSAHHDEIARDDGPVPGHSLFTGCLVGALLGDLFAQLRKPKASTNQIGAFVQDRVRELAHEKQNPLIETISGHDHGQLYLPILKRGARPRPAPVRRPVAPVIVDEPPVVARSEGWILEPTLAASLDRQGAGREQGYSVLSMIAGERMTSRAAWATWAAHRGFLTLCSDGRSVEGAVSDLLAQMPWLRCLPEARVRLARAAKIAVDQIDATLDAKSRRDRALWIDRVAPLDKHAKVSGWLLTALREKAAAVPDLATAPVGGGELLAIACDLACPTAVLIERAAPDVAWLERAIGAAAGLVGQMPRRPIAVSAPAELVTDVLRRGKSTAIAMAREGVVRITGPAERRPGRGRQRTATALLAALAADRRTRGRFEADRRIELEGASIEASIAALRERIVVELDGWHHIHDPEGYERDRVQDRRLQRAGYFVLRFIAEDVDERLASTIDQIALALASRRIQGGLS